MAEVRSIEPSTVGQGVEHRRDEAHWAHWLVPTGNHGDRHHQLGQRLERTAGQRPPKHGRLGGRGAAQHHAAVGLGANPP